jgi:hypothetical protein
VLRLSELDFNWQGSVAECEFTLKFRVIFLAEFTWIVTSGGKCPKVLYDCMSDVISMWASNTQEIEGTNNTIKAIGKAAPNISWELMSSRVVAKKDVDCLVWSAVTQHRGKQYFVLPTIPFLLFVFFKRPAQSNSRRRSPRLRTISRPAILL